MTSSANRAKQGTKFIGIFHMISHSPSLYANQDYFCFVRLAKVKGGEWKINQWKIVPAGEASHNYSQPILTITVRQLSRVVPVTFAYGKERLADDETKDTNRFIASLSTLQELHHLGFTILYLCPSFFHTNILGRAKRKNKSKTKENDGDERRKEKWNWKTTSAWLSFRCKIGQALVFLFISFHHTFVSPSAAIHISYKIQPPKVSFS